MTLTTTLFGGAALASGYWLWRKLRRQQRDAFIAGFAFPDRLRSKLQQRYPHLTPTQTGEVLRGLREYFQLCRLANRRMVAMPSQAVDLAWHEFILYTRQYRIFCRKGLGRFLHHVPNDVMPNQRSASEGIRRAWRLACLRENLDPRAPARLPLLFALDAQLGIADGFHYRLDCGANPGSYRSGDAYCASHIGCSSGCASGCSGDSGSSSGGSDGGGDGGGCGGGCGGGGGD
ncbi:hypothetical protein LRS11_06485 [Pseudomonas sp. J452]|uniref:glycine-rich domain-containing protein n=1 Tax=Pseudomonas sp. J452 TaxID=2898441 RepID=UPI0021ADF3F0|nr:hypothetical protein [Pseudomonas sp. J452]UUY09675.1 hypothetical protein LRS11_06485 [Pseudomonas sp. J452]